MTRLLYHADAYQRTFTAQVLHVEPREGRIAVILDQTAFYPAAGGQPCDHGTLADARVEEVFAAADGAVIHLLNAPTPLAVGATVHGAIDWLRRSDHMQQHTGQHILSQAFVRIASMETRSMHIGSEDNTIDLDTPTVPSPETVRAVEAEANRVVFDDLPVRTYTVSEAEVSHLPLRRPPQARGQVRIVEMEGYDWSACGGTHVRNTAQVGLIKIIRVERYKGGARVTFRCGRRALADYAQLHEMVSALSAALSAPRYEVAAVALRAVEEARSLQRALDAAKTTLRQHEAHALLAAAPLDSQQRRWVIHVVENAAPADLRALAQMLISHPGVVALVAGAGAQAQLVFARSEDVNLDVAALLRRALAQLAPDGSAKGGGSPRFAQGGGFIADTPTLQGLLRALMCADHP